MNPLYAQNIQQLVLANFQSTTFEPNRMDVQHTPIYDTVTIAAGGSVNQNTASWFTNVGPQSGKTDAQTNLTQAGRLAAPEAFSIQSFRFRWSENLLLADALSILSSFCLVFTIGKKPYQQAPIWYYPAGGGLAGWNIGPITAAASPSTNVISNGMPTMEATRRLAIPIVIENQMNFEAHLQGNPYTLTASGGTGGTGLALTLLLDGYYARGVQ